MVVTRGIVSSRFHRAVSSPIHSRFGQTVPVTDDPTPAVVADPSTDPAADPELTAELMAMIADGLADEPGIRVCYQVRPVDGIPAESAPQAAHYSASTMKLPLVLAAYRRRD